MDYDYTGVTEIRHDRAARRLEVRDRHGVHTIEGVERLMLKSVPWIDADGTVRLNSGRVSISADGREAAAGD